jgi:class 3 adenylate cyclase
VLRQVAVETGLAVGIGFGLGRLVARLRERLARFQAERAREASKFLGPVVSDAIFSNREDLLKNAWCRGFVISLDLRSSTQLTKELGARWLEFRREYFALVGRTIEIYGGYVQKTVGDAHVICFGIMEPNSASREDLPPPATPEGDARARLESVGDRAFAFLHELFAAFGDLARDHFPERLDVLLGGGIDQGWVQRGLQGSPAHQLELDVNGDPVNCSNRLQEFSKLLINSVDPGASLLVVSPFAAEFLRDVKGFERVATELRKVRSYPGIRWLLVRRYEARALGTGAAAA